MSNQGYGGPQDPYGQQPNQPEEQPQQPRDYQGQPYQQQPYQQPPYPGGYQQGPQYGGRPVGDPGTLDLPWYGIGFGQAISRAFKKYVRFDGRASRSEFWWFYLFNTIVSFILNIPYFIVYSSKLGEIASGATPNLAGAYAAQIPAYIWGLIVLLPNLGLMWRRLHDTGRSGAWFFLVFACGIGGLVPLIMCIMDSNPEGQKYDRVRGLPPRP